MAPVKQAVISSSSAYNATDVLVGGLPGGYFVTAEIGATDHTLYLRNVSDMATAVDSLYCAYKFFPGDGLTQYGTLTANGDIFYKDDEATTTFYRVSQSGGVLVVTTIGPVDVEPLGASYLMVSNDGAQIVVVSTLDLYGYDAVTGAQEYVLDLATALGTANLVLVSIPKPNRVLAYNGDTDEIVLTDETGTTLDSMSAVLDPRLYQCAPGTDLGVLVTRALTDSAFTYNYIEVTAGDVVSWRWGTSKTIATSWSGWTGSNLATRVATYGGTCAITMRDRSGSYSPRSIYWIDVATGDYTESDVSVYAANGGYAINPCGTNSTVLWGLSMGTWSGWQSTTPTYLRQRQSPVRSPSRVRPYDLRQRQTPIITK